MVGRVVVLSLLMACGRASPAPVPAAEWPQPAGWKSETIPFPLGFAPDVKHAGVEELRFAPGWGSSAAPGYWSYTFVWHLEDPALLDAPGLTDELTRYFRGLYAAVAAGKSEMPDAAMVSARAVAAGTQFTLTVDMFDAFGDGRPVTLVGWARRTSCGAGALWTFVLAPPVSGLRPQLDTLARAAGCRESGR